MDTNYIINKLEAAKNNDWYQKFEVIKNSGIISPGWANVKPEYFFNEIGLHPELLKNKRVLDIGADAGAYSFFMEDCSARVTALDPRDPDRNGFNIVKSIRESKVKYVRELAYNLTPEKHGFFDIILLINVSQLLKHPLLALEKINSVCRDGAILIGGWQCCDSWFPAIDTDRAHSCGVNFSRITRKFFWKKKHFTAKSINDLSICGFGNEPETKSIYFYPNSTCFFKWLEVSGFKPEFIKKNKAPLWSKRSGTQNKQRRIPLSFQELRSRIEARAKKNRKMTQIYFRAQFVGPAQLEYGERQLRATT